MAKISPPPPSSLKAGEKQDVLSVLVWGLMRYLESSEKASTPSSSYTFFFSDEKTGSEQALILGRLVRPPQIGGALATLFPRLTSSSPCKPPAHAHTHILHSEWQVRKASIYSAIDTPNAAAFSFQLKEKAGPAITSATYLFCASHSNTCCVYTQVRYHSRKNSELNFSQTLLFPFGCCEAH